MIKNSKYLMSILMLIAVSAFGQQADINNITQKFKTYRDVSFQEKLFVHIDQDFYLTGEMLWFRIFCVDGTFHKPSTLSKVAFVEILDRNNKAVLQSKVPLDADGGHGSLFIPATFGSGTYLVRVYTQWMRNYGPDYFFQKQISIVNPFIKPENAAATAAPKLNVEFFPEGGNLVAGLKSKVAFKVSSEGKALTGRGAIIKNNTDTVEIITPLKFGLGSFSFTPAQGDEYKCVFKSAEGLTGTYAFPRVYDEGYVLELSDVNESDLNVKVRVRTSQKDKLSQAYLFVHARQSIILAEAKPVYPEEANFTISKAKLPDGISHITIFDGAERPVCERLYFKAPANPLHLQLKTDQASYTTRRKVTLNVSSVVRNIPTPADISLAVYRLDSLSDTNEENILTYLYLQSDLRGSIDSAAFYFSRDVNAIKAADNLMLTHGWRRFNWDQVLQGKNAPKFIPEVRSHLITGKVSNQDGTPAAGILTYLSSPGKLVNVYGARSNKDGLVHFEVRDFWGSRQLILQTNTNADSTYKLSVNNPYDESTATQALKTFRLPETAADKLAARSLSMQVQDIYYREAHDKIVSQKNDSTAFFGQPDETYYLDDYTRFPVMEEVMREYVPGALVRKRKDGFHFIIIDRVNKGVLEGDPLVLLDGMPVFDLDKIMSFDPLKVKKLEVVTRTFYVGPLVLAGIVSYSTYQGDLGGFSIDPRSVSINYEGLQLQREFYSPRYENQKQRSSRLPDQRNLLHWVPVLKTDGSGNSVVDFYTSDLTGDFIVVAQGLGASGIAGSGVHKFTVKRNDF